MQLTRNRNACMTVIQFCLKNTPKCNLRASDFKNFPGGHAPTPPRMSMHRVALNTKVGFHKYLPDQSQIASDSPGNQSWPVPILKLPDFPHYVNFM